MITDAQKKQLAFTHGITYVLSMKTITATSARTDLYSLIDTVLQDHQPVQITGKRGNAVLVSESDWQSIQETIFLLNIPGMRDSILEGMRTGVDECSEDIDL